MKDANLNMNVTPIPVRDWSKEEDRIADIKRMINLYATTYTDGDIDAWIKQNLYNINYEKISKDAAISS
jgi:hypothetical protein